MCETEAAFFKENKLNKMKKYINLSITERILLKSNIKHFQWVFAYNTLIEAAVFGGDYRVSLFN